MFAARLLGYLSIFGSQGAGFGFADIGLKRKVGRTLETRSVFPESSKRKAPRLDSIGRYRD